MAHGLNGRVYMADCQGTSLPIHTAGLSMAWPYEAGEYSVVVFYCREH